MKVIFRNLWDRQCITVLKIQLTADPDSDDYYWKYGACVTVLNFSLGVLIGKLGKRDIMDNSFIMGVDW